MHVVKDQDFLEGLKISDNMILQDMLLRELDLANGNQLVWEFSIPMPDSEFVRYNGTTLDLAFSRDVLFYEKVSDKVEVEATLHKSFMGKTDNQDSILRDYGSDLSDELRQIISANELLEENKEDKQWIAIDLMAVGSVRRSDISTIQCNSIPGGLYRVVMSSTTSDIIIHLDDVEMAILVVTLLECYRDHDNFIDVAAKLNLDLLSANQQ